MDPYPGRFMNALETSVTPRFYIQSFQMTEYFSPERALSVRLCVCLSVTAFYLNTIEPILMKIEPHDLNKILR